MTNKKINVVVPRADNFRKRRYLKKSIKQDFKLLKKLDCRYCTAQDCSGCTKLLGQAKMKQLERHGGKSEFVQDYDLSNQPTVEEVNGEIEDETNTNKK